MDKGNLQPLLERKELLDKITDYIEHNLNKKITLQSAAHKFLISESSLSKLFREKLNTSFLQYIIKRRIIAAKRYIVKGENFKNIYEL